MTKGMIATFLILGLIGWMLVLIQNGPDHVAQAQNESQPSSI